MSIPFPLSRCTVIITGASSGLGAEFARQLAENAACLVLAARSEDALQKLAAELKTKTPALGVIVCPCDLSKDAGRIQLWNKVIAAGIKPNLLINNAGLGDYGAFAISEESRLRQQIDLNITALTLLTRVFIDHVRPTADKPAAILNVSSLASTMAVPDLSVYAATKAYVTSFTEGLNAELQARHIHVMAVCPGPTPTNFGKNATRSDGTEIDRGGQDVLQVTPAHVVTTALNGLTTGKVLVFPGTLVGVLAALTRLLPRVVLRALLMARYSRSLKKNAPVHV